MAKLKASMKKTAIKKLAENIYEFQGRCDIETVEEMLVINYDEDLEQVTIGGYVFNLLGRLPMVGDRIEDELCYYEVKKNGWEFYRAC